METKVFNAVMAMSMMDDALVSEAAAPVSSKKRAVRGSHALRYAAAAAAFILLAGGIFAFIKLPRDENGRFAFLPPKATEILATSAPAATAEPAATGEPKTPEATSDSTALPAPYATADSTSEPLPPSAEYYSFDEFIDAVRKNADPLLEGIDRWYEAPALPEGSRLNRITVLTDEVEYSYELPAGGCFEYSWLRSGSASQEYYYSLVNNKVGTWHGELFIYLSQAGRYFAAELDEGCLLRMWCTENCTESEMAEYCGLIRRAI